MAVGSRTWKLEHRTSCAHAGGQVTLISEFVAPAEILPLTPPRLRARSCSHYCDCHLQDKTQCGMAVTTAQGILLPTQFV